MPQNRWACWCAVALILFVAISEVQAQVDQRILTQTWKDEDHWADTWDKPLVIARSPLQGQDQSISVFHWDSYGRIKFDRAERDPGVWLGYRILTVSIDSDIPTLDHSFVDLALAAGGFLGSLGEGWMLLGSAGIGTANDGRFDRTEAIYPLATLEAAHLSDPGHRWHVGLSLDGNRTLLPDIPLPYFYFDSVPVPELHLRLGNLASDLAWKPSPFLDVTVGWRFPTNSRVRMESSMGGGFAVFAEASRSIDGFHLRDQGDTRLFYQLAKAEAGVRFIASWIDVSLSAGYALGQRFLTGFDLRDLDRFSVPRNRPFLALTLQGTF
jgi:hypothetical protein